MTLYDKGHYGYTEILTYISSQMENDISNCIYCQKQTICSGCSDEKLGDYFTTYVIHRLYFSLFQMTKSYLVPNGTDHLSHNWQDHKTTLNSKTKTSMQNNNYQFTCNMSNLKKCRQKADYEVFDHKKDRIVAINLAKNAKKYLQKIESNLGNPLC